MDGVNMNVQIGFCSFGEIGVDVCYFNLYKIFCIFYGGGGLGVGFVCVKKYLGFYFFIFMFYNYFNYIIMQVISVLFGSVGIFFISWLYIVFMGVVGFKKVIQVGFFNVNYFFVKFKFYYLILYINEYGRCVYEFILDVWFFQVIVGIEVIDIVKCLQDYGFYVFIMSWFVVNIFMIEFIEFEFKEEFDCFVDVFVSICEEICEIEEGKVLCEGNVLKMVFYFMVDIIGGDGEEGSKWDRFYSCIKVVYLLFWFKEKKFWFSVVRINDSK